MLRQVITLLLLVSLLPITAHGADVNLRLLADLVLSGDEDLHDLNRMRTGDSYADFMHARVFLDAGSDRTAFFLQLVMSDVAEQPVRIFGAYLQHQILESREIYVQAGKIPTPQGTWGPRTYADRNPLVGVPFAYFWQSGLPVISVPPTLDDLVASSDGATTYGALMLYDNCWHEGVSLLGAHGPLSWTLAASRGAPGNPVAGESKNDDIAVHARVGFSPIPEIQAAFSWGQGAYLNRDAAADLAPGQSVNDYDQNIIVGSLKLARGYFEFNGEYFWNHYETPLRADGLHSWSIYGDLEWNFAAGWHAAVRYDTMRFEVVDTIDGPQSWDTDLQRLEGGIAYHVNRDFLLKAVLQANDVGEGFSGDTLLPMLQAVVAF
jgi:hypothetical protein